MTAGYVKSWNSTGVLEYASGSNDMSDGRSICWIESLGSLSAGNEKQNLTGVNGSVPSGWFWRQTVTGWKAVSGSARCAYLGKAYTLTGYANAYVNQSVSLGASVANNACFFQSVEGNLDGGYAYLRRDAADGIWRVEASGGVDRAEAYCIAY
jgi:hypothetical protein